MVVHAKVESNKYFSGLTSTTDYMCYSTYHPLARDISEHMYIYTLHADFKTWRGKNKSSSQHSLRGNHEQIKQGGFQRYQTSLHPSHIKKFKKLKETIRRHTALFRSRANCLVGRWVSAAPAEKGGFRQRQTLNWCLKRPHLPHFHHNEPRLQLLSGMSEYAAVVTPWQHSLSAGGH